MADRVLGNASSPVSAIEAIEPAERIWAYTNGRGLRVWTPMMPALAGVHEEQEYVHSDVHAALARQAEALTGIGSAHDLISDWLGEGTDDLPDETPVRVEIGKRAIVIDNLGSLRRARALLGGSENAE